MQPLGDSLYKGRTAVVARLMELVESFGGRRALLVGDFILDRYVYGDAERISPEAPVPVLRVVGSEQRAGGCGSVAANLRALGLSVVCCGVVGQDKTAEQLIALLEAAGVDCTGLLRDADRPTTTKTRYVGLAQHRHRQQLMRVDEEESRALADAVAARLQAFVASAVSSVDVVCMEDYGKGVITDKLAQAIIEAARAAGKPVLVDPAAIPSYAKYRRATLITPNRNEFRLVVGQPCETPEQIEELAAPFVRGLDLDALVVTMDRDGAILAERGRDPVRVPTRPRAVYDNTGAGDAVLAMLAAALAAGAAFEQAVHLANVAGGLEVEKFGCVPITRDEVLAELRMEQRAHSGKLRTLEALLAELTLRRDRGETVVFTNGCFDLLHPGHVTYLARCRELGDIVVVGLNSDDSVRAQNKGPDRPILNQRERARMLGALESVDYIVVFDEPDPSRLIEQIRPDVLVKGEDWADKWVCGREFVESYGGKVELVPLVDGYSTTSLVERIRRAGAGS